MAQFHPSQGSGAGQLLGGPNPSGSASSKAGASQFRIGHFVIDAEMLRRYKKEIIGGSIGLLLLMLLGYYWLKPLTPEQVLERIASVENPADLPQIRRYCTDQGYSLLEWGVKGGSDVPSHNPQLVLGTPRYSGDTCDLPYHTTSPDGETRGSCRLLKKNGWKFHDLYIQEVNGNRVDLWMSYAKDHPVKTFLRQNGRFLLEAFLQGFAIGASMAG